MNMNMDFLNKKIPLWKALVMMTIAIFVYSVLENIIG